MSDSSLPVPVGASQRTKLGSLVRQLGASREPLMLLALLHQPSFVGGGVRSGACTAAPYTAAVCQNRRSRTPQAAAEELPGLTFEDMCSAHATSLATLAG